MTDLLGPEEIAQWRECVIADHPHPINKADLLHLLDIAEDHARLRAENAKLRELVLRLQVRADTFLGMEDERDKLRERAEKLERLYREAKHCAGEIGCDDFHAALATCEEEEGS